MSNTIGQLDPTFTQLIASTMQIERQPLTRLQTQRDQVDVQRGIYTDLKNNLDGLQSAVKALLSTEASYALAPGRKASTSGAFVTATGALSQASVATATASGGAVPAAYTLEVTHLALAHRVASEAQVYTDQALSLSGKFVIGGAAARSVSGEVPVADMVDDFDTAAVDAGQRELGSGDYYVETRQDPANGAWQFRLVDGEGKAASIRLVGGDGYYSGWQDIPSVEPEGTVVYDTGRGLTFTFGDGIPTAYAALNRSTGAAKVTYTAQGAEISVEAGDSLDAIAASINEARYAEGDELIATIVNRQLILTASRTGAGRTLQAADTEGTVLASLGVLSGVDFAHELQAPRDAAFKVNGMDVTRSRNDALTDVISGVTLNLAPDAEGKTTTLTIAGDTTAQKSAINAMITGFNTLQTYLAGKLAVTKQADGTYKRGALSGDSMLNNLRNDLLRSVNASVANAGTLRNLRQIGLDFDDDLKLKVSDAAKLEGALSSDTENVRLLLDAVMQGVDDRLSRYTGTSGYVQQSIKSSDGLKENLNDRISSLESRLAAREAALTNQYAAAQSQLYLLSYQQQQLNSIYGVINQMV